MATCLNVDPEKLRQEVLWWRRLAELFRKIV